MPIYDLRFTNLGPFDEIDFQFDPQVNVFVGPNNCGKSTVLMGLANLAVADFAVPEKLLKGPESRFEAHIEQPLAEKAALQGVFPIASDSHHWRGRAYADFEKRQRELGYTCLIPALRWSTDYQASAARPDRPIRQTHDEESRIPFLRAAEPGEISRQHSMRASLMRDDAIIQKIVDLDYRAYREEKPAIRRILHRIGVIASQITDGFPIEFAAVTQGGYGLYPEFKTADGTLPFSVLSQGTQSIIQWLGLFLIGYAEYYEFPETLEDKPGVMVIDEIDAHMHPSWQRRILPTLSRHFPSVQIFCSSHSPFVLAGLKAGQAQLLKRDDKGKVVVSRNQTDVVGWSMDEILRNFLDITNPTDLQTSENIERLQELRAKKRLTGKQKQELEHLREVLGRDLLAGPAATEIERFAERIRNPGAQSPSAPKSLPTNKGAKKASAARTRRSGAKRTGRQR